MDGIELVVTHVFGGYAIGEVIADPAAIKDILSGPHELYVVKRKAALPAAPVPPAPAAHSE